MRLRPAITILFLLVEAALLTAGTATWWAHRHNTLFDHGRWIIGKDTGKFVFYTYGFMFEPLEEHRVDLSHAMAFQEILYRRPSSERAQLQRLACEAFVAANGYLWIELEKQGLQTAGIRISQNHRFPSGFYRFNDTGDRIFHAPFDAQIPDAAKGWRRVEIVRQDGTWVLRIQGQPMGALELTSDGIGHFGFRGSGNTRAKILVRNIEFGFRDPGTGREWTETETFKPRFSAKLLAVAVLLGLAAVLLRWLRQETLAGYLTPPRRRRFALADHVGLSLSLLVPVLVSQGAAGVWLPTAIFTSELVTLVTFGIHRVRGGSTTVVSRGWPVVVYVVLFFTLLTAGWSKHGEWLGRAQRSIWSHLNNVHPAAFTTVPTASSPSPPFTLREPVMVSPCRPFFADGYAYREQVLTCQFIMASNTTMDVVFQQQAYITRGDPEGEALPLQRRLLRFSTRDDVPTGFAVNTRCSPAPFIRVAGDVRAGEPAELTVRSTESGTFVSLNGVETHIRKYGSLGYGLTGCLVLEGSVRLTRLDIRPAPAAAAQARWLPIQGVLLPLLLALFVWLAARPFGPVPYAAIVRLECCALFPWLFYVTAALPLDSKTLAFLGETRVAWLDLMLTACASSHLLHLIVLRTHIRKAAVWYANVIVLTACCLFFLFVWDHLLPPKHPLRIRFAHDAIEPGELVEQNAKGEGPWYTNNRLIGADTFLWRHEFGGEPIDPVKAPGTIRVFVVGGSQAWGSGAARSADTFDGLLERRLRAKGLPVEIFNAGINGAGISKVAHLYEGLIETLQPDILILDVGLNDSAAIRVIRRRDYRAVHLQILLGEFAELIDRCQRQGVDVVLSQEAMSGESPLRRSTTFYKGMIAAAREKGAVVLDAQPVMREKEVDHFVWWDTAHLAPFGHELLARILEPEVERLVRMRLARAAASSDGKRSGP